MRIISPYNKILFIAFFLALFSLTRAQDKFPQGYFANPLTIPISLAGTFGEIRSNHFHTGLDIRTDGKEGLPVLASANGYICRINVSPYGYGNALYIKHPNGFVTVYGHLSRYNPAIAAYVKERQYELQKFAVDLYPNAGEMAVKKGDTVAFSGSTGAAEGPHLHFEIRDDKEEDPINPMLFGLACTDKLPPVIAGISVYPLNDSSNVNGRHEPVYINTVNRTGTLHLAADSAINAYGMIGIGIRTYDMADGADNHNGPYTEVLMDAKDTLYYSRMDDLSFGAMRYINGHVDYEAFLKKKETFEHSFLEDNDKLDIYKKVTNRGRIKFEKGAAIHHLKYDVSDFQGNNTELLFDIGGETVRGSIRRDTIKYKGMISWKKPFDYHYKGMSLHIPTDAIFQNVRFYCSDAASPLHTLCPIYHIINEYVPLSSSYTLNISPSAPLPDSVLRKAVIIQWTGGRIHSVGGAYDSGSIIAHPKSFGDFSIMLDLVRPEIKPLNIYKGKNMSKATDIEFEISDNLSGIAGYNAYVDGKWILMGYNPKKDMIYYTFDEHVKEGNHHLKLVVTDNVGNVNTYEVDFTR